MDGTPSSWSARRKKRRLSESPEANTSIIDISDDTISPTKSNDNGPESTTTTTAEAIVMQCGICLSEDIDEQGILSCCAHVFCFECIFQWSKTTNTCPFWYVSHYLLLLKILRNYTCKTLQ